MSLACKDVCVMDIFIRNNHSLSLILQWRHNEGDGVSNHRGIECLLIRLCRRRSRSKKTPKLRLTGLFEGNPPVTGGFPHKGPVKPKMFSFDGVIMIFGNWYCHAICVHKRTWFWRTLIVYYHIIWWNCTFTSLKKYDAHSFHTGEFQALQLIVLAAFGAVD